MEANALNHNRDKELFSDPPNILLSVNGSQVWVDNKFEEESLEDVQFDGSATNLSTIDTEKNEKK